MIKLGAAGKATRSSGLLLLTLLLLLVLALLLPPHIAPAGSPDVYSARPLRRLQEAPRLPPRPPAPPPPQVSTPPRPQPAAVACAPTEAQWMTGAKEGDSVFCCVLLCLSELFSGLTLGLMSLTVSDLEIYIQSEKPDEDAEDYQER